MNEKNENLVDQPDIRITAEDLDAGETSELEDAASSQRQIRITIADLDAADPMKERRLLTRLLNEAGLEYSAGADYISIPFIYQDPSLFEEGTSVELIATWREDSITIEIPLLELLEDESLDPFLMYLMLSANYSMYLCKFGLAPYGVSLLVDLHATHLQPEEVEAGVNSLLVGFELYLDILRNWFSYLQETEVLSEILLSDDGWLVDEEIDAIAISEVAAQPAKKEGQVTRALLGIAKVGVTAGVLVGIAATVGVPPAGIATILAAVAAKKMS